MKKHEYLTALKRLVAINAEIEQRGIVAAMQYQQELKRLTNPVLMEALRRAENG